MSSRQRFSAAGFLLILLLFLFSGASGLVYQVIWVRLLTRIFGSTTFAVSALLAAFMGGLGLGSFVASRHLSRLRRPLRWFGVLELGIGVYALLLNGLLPAAERVFLDLAAGYELSLAGERLVKVALSFVVLGPPTTLMGASLPLLVKQSVSQLGSMGLRTGALYAVNTLGAAGCFAAGFYAIPSWGMETTTEAAALVNALVGLSAIAASLVFGEAGEAEPASPFAGATTSALRWAVGAFTLSGFVAIGLEVVWTRLFTLVFKGYTYSFTAMLTVLLLGIAVGSVVFGPRADRSRDLEGLLGIVQMAIGISALGLTGLLVFADDFQVYLLAVFGYDWMGLTLSKFFVSLVVLGGPTFLFGAQFPIVSRIATEEARRAGDRVGLLYALNVVGSIAGALVTGYALIPWLGSQGTLFLLTGSVAAMGVALVLRRGAASLHRRRLVAAGGFAAALAVALGGPGDLSRRIHEGWLATDEVLRHYEEGATATVMVGSFPLDVGAESRILVNGSSASNSGAYALAVNRVQGCIPFLFETMPKKVLATCFGTGITFGTLGQFDVDRIDGVDISPEVIRAAPAFAAENYGVVSNSRVTLHIDDGRNFLLKSRETYDVITMEPMPPALAGVSDMYTREFYALCREHLAPGGIMSQWVPLYFLTLDDVKMLYRTFAESFPHVMVFHHTFDTFLVGSDEPLRLSPEQFRERLDSERLIADLAAIELSEVEEMYATFLMGREKALEFAGDAHVVTDDLPLVEFTAPKAVDIATTPTNFLEITRYAEPITAYLREEDASVELLAALDDRFASKKQMWDNARRLADERARSLLESRTAP